MAPGSAADEVIPHVYIADYTCNTCIIDYECEMSFCGEHPLRHA